MFIKSLPQEFYSRKTQKKPILQHRKYRSEI